MRLRQLLPMLTGALVVAGALMVFPGTASADTRVYVRFGPPPPPVVHRVVVAPRPGLIWAPGYYRWTGRAYAWVPGAYVRPPRGRAVWVPGHWARNRYGWFWVGGHWR